MNDWRPTRCDACHRTGMPLTKETYPVLANDLLIFYVCDICIAERKRRQAIEADPLAYLEAE